jgi:hypothetical protein
VFIVSVQGIDQVLYRWLLDPCFRDALAADPEATLKSYDLDKEERARLSCIKGGRQTKERRPKGTALSARPLAQQERPR